MHLPLKEALRQRRGKSLDLTIMVGPGDKEEPPQDEDASEDALEKEAAPRAFHGKETPEEEMAEDDMGILDSLSDREKQKLMEEEPRSLMDKVKKLALMRKGK